MSETPETNVTKQEFLARSVRAPWMVTGALWVVGLLIMGYLAMSPPPVDQGRRTESDMRMIYIGLVGFGMLCLAIWAYFATRTWKALSTRGVLTHVDSLNQSILVRRGVSPMTISYVVNGEKFSFRQDMTVADIAILRQNVRRARILYDPQKPSRAKLLDFSVVDSFVDDE